MSTRSRIGMINPYGSVSSIYCHFDGYPEGVGKTLHDNWNDIDDIIELIANGDISPTEEDYYNLDPIMIEYHYLYKNGEWICKEVNLKEYFNESSS